MRLLACALAVAATLQLVRGITYGEVNAGWRCDAQLSTNYDAGRNNNCFCAIGVDGSSYVDILAVRYGGPGSPMKMTQYLLDNDHTGVTALDYSFQVLANDNGEYQQTGIACGTRGIWAVSRPNEVYIGRDSLANGMQATRIYPNSMSDDAALGAVTQSYGAWVPMGVAVCQLCDTPVVVVAWTLGTPYLLAYVISTFNTTSPPAVAANPYAVPVAGTFAVQQNALSADGTRFVAYMVSGGNVNKHTFYFNAATLTWTHDATVGTTYASATTPRPRVSHYIDLARYWASGAVNIGTPDTTLISYGPVSAASFLGDMAVDATQSAYVGTVPTGAVQWFQRTGTVLDASLSRQYALTSYTLNASSVSAHPRSMIFYVSSSAHPFLWVDIGTTQTVPTPTASPTLAPTSAPTNPPPSATPTTSPTPVPSAQPTGAPSAAPTRFPTAAPTPAPSTATPTASPTSTPTAAPSAVPTATPTARPTAVPSASPTASPSAPPTPGPTALPGVPTASPTAAPSPVPSTSPTAAPSAVPTAAPSAVPTATPTLAPSAAPTRQPTPAPSPAPGPVWPVSCANTRVYGTATTFNASTCTWGQTCVFPDTSACPPGLHDMALSADGRRCGGFVRACRDSEYRARCPSSPIVSAPNCSMLCDLEDPQHCEAFGNAVCPPAAPATVAAPSALCVAMCGPAVLTCGTTGTYTNISDCICAAGAIATPNAMCDNVVTVARTCTAAESQQYCGIDQTLRCRFERLFANQFVAPLIEAWFDETVASPPSYSDIRALFVDGNVNGALIPSARGTTTVDVPSCLCLNASAYQRCLPQWNATHDNTLMDTSIYTGASRIFYATCAGGSRDTGHIVEGLDDAVPNTLAGPCNGVGTVYYLPVFVNSFACGETAWLNARSILYRGGTQYTSDPSSDNGHGTFPFAAPPPSFFWGMDHVLVDLYAPNVTAYGNAAAKTFLCDYLQASGCSGPYLPMTDLGERYFIQRTNPYDCEFNYLATMAPYCGRQDRYWTAAELTAAGGSSAAPHYERCLDPRSHATIRWVTRTIRHPVLQCLDLFGAQPCPGMDASVNSSALGCVAVASVAAHTVQRAHGPTFCTPTQGGTRAVRNSLCTCPPFLSGLGCTTRRCAANATCARGFLGTNCTVDGAPCIMPTGWTGRTPCDNHGTFNWTAGACDCDPGWLLDTASNSSTFGSCTVHACNHSSFSAWCETMGGACLSEGVCTACPHGRSGVDCSQCRVSVNGGWGGVNCLTPIKTDCVHGAPVVLDNRDFSCTCDEGWGGELCNIPMCSVTNGQVCNGHGRCTRVAAGSVAHRCQQPWTAAADTLGRGTALTCNLNGTTDQTSNWAYAGCGCEMSTLGCVAPGDAVTRLCSGRLDANGYPVCAVRLRSGAAMPVEETYCVCPPRYSGQFCEVDSLVSPTNGYLCNGRGNPDSYNATCTCNTVSTYNQGTDRTTLGVGTMCEINVTAACGVLVPGSSVNYMLCASTIGTNPCLFVNGTYRCTSCANGNLPSNNCAPQTTAPTPAPTSGGGGATPTAAPTPAPTFGNFTLLPLGSCGYCSGACYSNIANASAPFCICPYPAALAYDVGTGDCTRNVCPNTTTLRVVDNAAHCVCTDPAALQTTVDGVCQSNVCPVVGGRECGALFPLDTTADPTQRACVAGVCQCSKYYVLNATSGACAFRCSAANTVGINVTNNNTCQCATGFDPATGCRMPLCQMPCTLDAGTASCLCPTNAPSAAPSAAPTATPSAAPTYAPGRPTPVPSTAPSAAPSTAPTAQPSARPTASPSAAPGQPTAAPTGRPTAAPSATPTATPTARPTAVPSAAPGLSTAVPSAAPTATPTQLVASAPAGSSTSTALLSQEAIIGIAVGGGALVIGGSVAIAYFLTHRAVPYEALKAVATGTTTGT